MRLLALADIHNQRKVLSSLQKILEQKWDWVLIAGDITNRGDTAFVEDLFDILPLQTLAVHGNMDTTDVIKLLEEKRITVHGKRKELGEYNIVGFGGSNPTPADTPTEYSENKIEDELSQLEINHQTILLTHTPPFNSGLDEVGPGFKVGSRTIREIIDTRQPCLNICGHIHEQEGKRMLGRTLVIKLAPAMHGRAAEINIDNNIEVRFFDF
ncbi:MAG: metallophosphoesterase [bacterium]